MRGARVALAIDVVLGLLVTVAVLLHAVVFATIVVTAFRGELPSATSIAALAAIVVARGILAGGFESVGRRAAVRILSQLRLTLVERRLTEAPLADDGAEAAEIATAAVQGVDGLQTYFARYLPSWRWRRWCRSWSWLDGGDRPHLRGDHARHAADHPRVHDPDRSRDRGADAGSLGSALAALDALRGRRPRAPDPACVQPIRTASGSDRRVEREYRRTTMDVLRVSFVSGAVLDLTATIATALVAVTLGSGSSTVRSDSGRLTILLLTPELYAPLRALAAQFHASADGLAAADRIIDLIDGTSPPMARGGADPPPAWRSVRLEGCASTTPIAPRRSSTGSISRSDGRDRRADGCERGRQEHGRLAPPRTPLAGRGRGDDRRARPRLDRRRRVAAAGGVGAAASDDVPGSARENVAMSDRGASETAVRDAVRAASAEGSSRTCRADRTP